MFAIRAFLSLLLVPLLLGVAPVNAAPSIVVDVENGYVFSATEIDRHWAPASLTKLMTAYVTFLELENGALSMTSPVRISSNAASAPPSRMGYGVGSVLTVDNALKMLIIKSANDIAVALAEAVSGTEAEFVARMNEEAAKLGMSQTRFANPHGLDDPQQYSTARDLARLARSIRKRFPQHDSYFAAEGLRTGDNVTPTYNILLGRYAGADGMKTGFVCASGFNLVGTATRDGSTLVSVVMGALSQKLRAEKSATLLEEGFAAVKTKRLYPTVDNLPINTEETAQKVADLRPVVCTQQAQESRWDGRQIEGYITFDTPVISALNRPLKTLSARLGGADGVSKSAVMLNGTFIAAYPVPQTKPERPTLLEAGDEQRFGLRPGFDAPVPQARPQI